VYLATRAWFDGLAPPRRRYHELGATPVVDQLRLLVPLQAPPKRELIVGTSGGWTAHFDNSMLGGDPVSWVGHLSRQLDCQGVIATHIPRSQYVYPSTQFELLGPTGEKPLQYVRTISAGIYDEGHWRFDTWGAEQPFEESQMYSRRLVRDRFTRQMLLRYLSALGIEADDPAFYGDGVLIENRARWRTRTLSIPDARREYAVPPTG